MNLDVEGLAAAESSLAKRGAVTVAARINFETRYKILFWSTYIQQFVGML